MTGAARHAVRAVGVSSAVAALAALGLPAVAAIAGLAVLLLATACWVLANQDRSDRLARIILGVRGNPSCLRTPAIPEHDAASAPEPGSPDHPPREVVAGVTRNPTVRI